MLYLDFVQNREDFILEGEEKYPYIIKKILCFIRKFFGLPIKERIDGKEIVLISKFNKKVAKKLEKIFKIDVTKNVCICEKLRENKEFMDFLKEKELNIMDGRWLFKYLICDVSEFICNKFSIIPEKQEISILVDEPNIIVFETIKRLSSIFKNVNVITNKIRKFDKLEEELYEEKGVVLNITNNFKKACLNSKIIINYNLDEKEFGKVRFGANSIVINLEKNIEVKQSNFRGECIDFYSINLPYKYRKIYKRLNNFNSSILYESLIYKKTSIQNIWREIESDESRILCLQSGEKNVFI